VNRPVTYIDGLPMPSGQRGDLTCAVLWYGGKLLLLMAAVWVFDLVARGIMRLLGL
jgi:hypothetical protein